MSAVERNLREERLGRRRDSEEAVFPAMLARFSFVCGERGEVALVLELLSRIVRANVTSNLALPIEHAHEGVRGDDGESLPDVDVRDGIVVSVEADVGRFPRGDGSHEIR